MQGAAATAAFCGMPEYMAPEAVGGRRYTRGRPVGPRRPLFEMLAGTVPFFDPNASRMSRMIAGDAVEFPAHFSAAARDLIPRLLESDPGKRLGVAQRTSPRSRPTASSRQSTSTG
jgi:serine/threonine protein kinase